MQRCAIVKRINAENVERKARGEDPVELPKKLFEEAPGSMEGLVPTGGGPRVGQVRLEAFLKMVGGSGAEATNEATTKNEGLL